VNPALGRSTGSTSVLGPDLDMGAAHDREPGLRRPETFIESRSVPKIEALRATVARRGLATDIEVPTAAFLAQEKLSARAGRGGRAPTSSSPGLGDSSVRRAANYRGAIPRRGARAGARRASARPLKFGVAVGKASRRKNVRPGGRGALTPSRSGPRRTLRPSSCRFEREVSDDSGRRRTSSSTTPRARLGRAARRACCTASRAARASVYVQGPRAPRGSPGAGMPRHRVELPLRARRATPPNGPRLVPNRRPSASYHLRAIRRISTSSSRTPSRRREPGTPALRRRPLGLLGGQTSCSSGLGEKGARASRVEAARGRFFLRPLRTLGRRRAPVSQPPYASRGFLGARSTPSHFLKDAFKAQRPLGVLERFPARGPSTSRRDRIRFAQDPCSRSTTTRRPPLHGFTSATDYYRKSSSLALSWPEH